MKEKKKTILQVRWAPIPVTRALIAALPRWEAAGAPQWIRIFQGRNCNTAKPNFISWSTLKPWRWLAMQTPNLTRLASGSRSSNGTVCTI